MIAGVIFHNIEALAGEAGDLRHGRTRFEQLHERQFSDRPLF